MPQKRSTPPTYQRAHNLRREPTEAESRLWSYLRSHRLRNVHFRQQHAIGKYVVDFCAPRQKIVIEVDGSQHITREKSDEERSFYIISKGYRILRFWNHEVMNNIEGVILAIEYALIDREKK